MIYINETKINDLLDSERDSSFEKFNAVLDKAKKLDRLSLAESALLLNTDDPERLEIIYKTAKAVKEEIYGKRLVLFAPLYVSNLCRNKCLYCAFRSDNKLLKRISLSPLEIKQQVLYSLWREKATLRVKILSIITVNVSGQYMELLQALTILRG